MVDRSTFAMGIFFLIWMILDLTTVGAVIAIQSAKTPEQRKTVIVVSCAALGLGLIQLLLWGFLKLNGPIWQG